MQVDACDQFLLCKDFAQDEGNRESLSLQLLSPSPTRTITAVPTAVSRMPVNPFCTQKSYSCLHHGWLKVLWSSLASSSSTAGLAWSHKPASSLLPLHVNQCLPFTCPEPRRAAIVIQRENTRAQRDTNRPDDNLYCYWILKRICCDISQSFLAGILFYQQWWRPSLTQSWFLPLVSWQLMLLVHMLKHIQKLEDTRKHFFCFPQRY